MRNDMSKVIVERPRRGGKTGSHHPYRLAKKFDVFIDEDGQLDVADEFTTGPNRAPMRARRLGYDHKQLNENLNPLWRYLDSQVGRLWDDVYSEVCEHINPNSTVQQHILVHLFQHVELNAYFGEDNKLYANTKYGAGPTLLDEESYFSRFQSLYVHPITGVLCKAKLVERKRYQEPTKLEFKFINDVLGFVKEEGIWYRVVSQKITQELFDELKAKALHSNNLYGYPYTTADIFGLSSPRFDFKEKKYLPIGPKDRYPMLQAFENEAKRLYGRAVWVIKKETANKRELRKHKLNEPKPLVIHLVKEDK